MGSTSINQRRKCLACGAVLRITQTSSLCNPCKERKREENYEKSSSFGIEIGKTAQKKIPEEGSRGKLLTLEEVAKKVRYTSRTVRKKIKQGTINVCRLPGGRKLLIKEEEIDRFLGHKIEEDRKFGTIQERENLPDSFLRLYEAIEILKSPRKTREDIERASRILEEIPFRGDTAKLYELFLAQSSNLLKPADKAEVLEGFRLIFHLKRSREDPLGVHLAQRSAHWMARSGEEEFILTVKRLYENEKIPFIKRGMMTGLVLSNVMEPEEFLDNFLDKESNQLLDILIYQMRFKDVPYSFNLLMDKEVKIDQNFENSMRTIFSELSDSDTKPGRLCGLRTLNNIITFGKEKVIKDLEKILSNSSNRKIFNAILCKEGLNKLWKVEIEKLRNFIMKEPNLKALSAA